MISLAYPSHQLKVSGGFAAEAFAGYDYVFANHFVLGAVANYMFNTAKTNASLTTTTVNNSQFSTRNLLGISAQLGYLLNSKTMLFLNVGPEWGWTKHSSTTNVSSASNTHNIIGINTEVGSKQIICDSHWFIQEKLGYMAFKTYNLVHTNNHTASVKTRFITGMIDVGYTF